MTKYTLRFLPYYEYDINAMENWLEDMAKKGYMFKNFFAGVACFEKTKPIKAPRFRFIHTTSGTGIFCENAGEPNGEMQQMSSSIGWQYIIGKNDFHIFYTDDSLAPELATDDMVTAMTVEEIKRKKRHSTAFGITYMFVYCIILSKLAGSIIMPMILMGTPLFLFSLFIIVANWVDTIKKSVYLNRLVKHLRGESIKYKEDIKYGFSGICKSALLILSVVWIFIFIGFLTTDEGVKMSDYTNEIPFATIDDMIEGEYKGVQFEYGNMNTIEEKHDILSPIIIDYNESADVILPNGDNWYGSLYVTYIEFRNEFLAKIATKEIVRIDKFRKGEFRIIASPDVNADYTLAYMYSDTTIANTPTVVMRKGNKVMRIEFYQYTGAINMEIWLETAADML